MLIEREGVLKTSTVRWSFGSTKDSDSTGSKKAAHFPQARMVVTGTYTHTSPPVAGGARGVANLVLRGQMSERRVEVEVRRWLPKYGRVCVSCEAEDCIETNPYRCSSLRSG